MHHYISRRDLVRWSLFGGGAMPVAAMIAACSDSGRTASPASPTTAPTNTSPPPGSTLPIDPTVPWWLQGNYAPVLQETDAAGLVIRGELPPEISGLYVKNGSNPPRTDSPHWFFGDGMVHGVRLGDGKASWYRNRYVQTLPHVNATGFAEGPPEKGNNQSNVSCIWHGGRLLTSGEVGAPYELSPTDLSTTGVYDFAGALPGSFTAHPKLDPATGRLHAFGYGFGAPYLQYYVIEPDGTMSHTEPVDIPAATMIHDFAITETDAVFWDLPVVFDLDRAVQFLKDPTVMPYVWKPELGARVGVMPLAGGARNIQWFEIEPCYVFHSVNAYRSGDEVIVDVCRLTSMFDSATPGLGGEGSLRRWTLNTSTGIANDRVLATDNPGDLPGRDPRRVGREHRYGYLTGTRENPDTVELGGIIRHDFRDDSRVMWEPGPTRHATEPLFLPGDTGDLADDAGWLLSFVHDDAAGETVLAVLDATDVAAGPVAEVVMPQRVPYGFHATFIPD